jgi:hypothetical protein
VYGDGDLCDELPEQRGVEPDDVHVWVWNRADVVPGDKYVCDELSIGAGTECDDVCV